MARLSFFKFVFVGLFLLPCVSASFAQMPEQSQQTPDELFIEDDTMAMPPAPYQKFKQIQLSEDKVAQVVIAMPEFQKKLDAYEEKYGLLEGDTPETHFEQLMVHDEVKADLESFSTKHGFVSFEDFMANVQSVFVTAAVLSMETEEGMTIAEQVEKARQSQQHIPEEMRAAVMQMVEQQLAQLQAMEPLPGNREAVKPHLADITALMEAEE